MLERIGDGELELVRDPDNPHDSNALAVFSNVGQLGFVPAEYAEQWSPLIDSGESRFTCGYFAVDEFKPEPGKRIVTLQLDVDEWQWQTRRGRGGRQPPENRRLDDFAAVTLNSEAGSPEPRGVSIPIWLIAVAILAGIVLLASVYQ